MRAIAGPPIKGLAAFLLAAILPAGSLNPLDQAGYAHMIAARHGKVVLVDFWATWCDPCREELPKLVALAKRFERDRFELVTVSADEPEQEADAAALLERDRVTQPYYIKRSGDDQTFIDSVDKQWSGALPALFLYDRSGGRIASFIGEADPGEIEAALRKIVGKQNSHE